MSNEINTVQTLQTKFGSGYWQGWTPTLCIVNNEIPKDVFDVSGSYGDTEAVKLDDISKKNETTYKYFISVSPSSIAWNYNEGLKQITVNVNSRQETYLNGVFQSSRQVGFNTSQSSESVFEIVTQTTTSLTLRCIDQYNVDGELYMYQMTLANAMEPNTRAILTMTWNP